MYNKLFAFVLTYSASSWFLQTKIDAMIMANSNTFLAVTVWEALMHVDYNMISAAKKWCFSLCVPEVCWDCSHIGRTEWLVTSFLSGLVRGNQLTMMPRISARMLRISIFDNHKASFHLQSASKILVSMFLLMTQPHPICTKWGNWRESNS